MLPFLFQAKWGLNHNFLLILFGVGLFQVLLTAPGGIVEQLPEGSEESRSTSSGGWYEAAAVGARGASA